MKFVPRARLAKRDGRNGSLRLVMALGLVLGVAAVVWFTQAKGRVEPVTDRATATGVPESTASELAEPAPGVGRVSGPSDAVPEGQAGTPRSERHTQILAALEPLAPALVNWPSGPDRSFDDCDMREVERAVRDLRLTAAEIFELTSEFSLRTDNGALLMGAFAYVPAPTEAELAALVDLVRNARGEVVAKPGLGFAGSHARGCYAAGFALRMQGANGALTILGIELLAAHQREEVLAGQTGARNFAAYVLSNVVGPLDPRLASGVLQLTRAAPEALLSASAWGALCRCGGADDATTVLRAALSGDGLAREGLERCRAPELTTELAGQVMSGRDDGYSKYVAESCARALLSVGDGPALEAFERALFDKKDIPVEATLAALDGSVPPVAFGGLLTISTRISDPERAKVAARAASRIRERVVRRNVPRDELERCLGGIRGNLASIDTHSQALDDALVVLAYSPSPEDHALVRSYLEKSRVASREQIEAVFAGR
jgi:hypothetical protein